jgi:hypothetical protein
MTLHKRLSKLEAQRQGQRGGPCVLLFSACSRDKEGNLQSIAGAAKVLTGSGWETIMRRSDEAGAEFQRRAETVAGDGIATAQTSNT